MDFFEKKKDFVSKTFFVYGQGVSGKSVVKFLKKEKVRRIFIFDDKMIKNINNASKEIQKVDFIVVSPGISLNKSKLYKHIAKNKHKIISDIDLYFMRHKKIKSIVVTGSNGKSTTCKLIYHLLKNNNIKTNLGGNIGKSILDFEFKKNYVYLIEASSFQLAYSKFVKPSYAILLNISNDHLDWHGTIKNYVNSKFKIFKNQTKKDHALISEEKLIKIFKRSDYNSKLRIVKSIKYLNNYKSQNKNFSLEINRENIKFIYEISKFFKISKKNFFKSLKSFSGLEHRFEIFKKEKNIEFINDSKSTNFSSSNMALSSKKNILWIVGGLPKKGDKIKTKNLAGRVLKAYIIGKSEEFYVKQIKPYVHYKICKNLHKAVKCAIKDAKNKPNIFHTILLSPAGASYDQFRNFEDRGKMFKKFIKFYAKSNNY